MSVTDSSVAIGVDIGGTKILAGCVNQAGDILKTKQVATPSTPTAILDVVGELCLSLCDSLSSVIGIGIGTAGMVNTETGQVVYANKNLPGWTGTDFSSLAIPDEIPLVVENDVRAMAFAEAILGVEKYYDSLLCITVGTGVGGGFVLYDDVWHGANYSAGEIGYLVVGWEDGQPIQLDQFVSGPAIERAFQVQSKRDTPISLIDIAERAQIGNTIARRVIQEKATQFGTILGGYVTSINPHAVLIGGGVPQIGALWWDAMESAFRSSVPPPVKNTPLIPSSLGLEAVMLGAGMLAWERSKA